MKSLYRKFWKIEYDNFSRLYQIIKEDINNEINRIIPFSFEEEADYREMFGKKFAKLCGAEYGLGVSSGTSALQLSLVAQGIGKGDEIITTPHTYIATALAITNTGATPVFVDIEEKSFNIDPSQIEDKITEKTKAIIPVHIYGQMAQMDPIIKIAKKYKLTVIEDACQAYGATYKNKRAGSIGDTGCFSFHHSKTLSGFGDGGFITTSDKRIYHNLKILTNPESDNKLILKSKRTPCQLDAIQIAFLNVKLKYFDGWLKRKREIAEFYKSNIKNSNIILPDETKDCKSTYRNFCILCKHRTWLKNTLLLNRIETRIHYKNPLHLKNIFKMRKHKKGDFPICEGVYKKILSLPINPFLSEEELKKIVNVINRRNI